MNTVGVCLCAGLAAALALLVALYRRVDALPLNLWRLVQRDRQADEKRALDALQEAAVGKVEMIVLGLRQYQDALEAQLRSEIGHAELRARVTERRSSDAGIALSAASALVAALRELVDDLPALLASAASHAGKLPPAPSVPADLANCPTVKIPPGDSIPPAPSVPADPVRRPTIKVPPVGTQTPGAANEQGGAR